MYQESVNVTRKADIRPTPWFDLSGLLEAYVICEFVGATSGMFIGMTVDAVVVTGYGDFQSPSVANALNRTLAYAFTYTQSPIHPCLSCHATRARGIRARVIHIAYVSIRFHDYWLRIRLSCLLEIRSINETQEKIDH